MTAMAASSLPSLEAEEDWGECLLALAAPAKICSDNVLPILGPAPGPTDMAPIPPLDVVALPATEPVLLK